MQFPLTLMGVSKCYGAGAGGEGEREKFAATHFINKATGAIAICSKFPFQMKLNFKEASSS